VALAQAARDPDRQCQQDEALAELFGQLRHLGVQVGSRQAQTCSRRYAHQRLDAGAHGARDKRDEEHPFERRETPQQHPGTQGEHQEHAAGQSPGVPWMDAPVAGEKAAHNRSRK
jgi:hypothetical protein